MFTVNAIEAQLKRPTEVLKTSTEEAAPGDLKLDTASVKSSSGKSVQSDVAGPDSSAAAASEPEVKQQSVSKATSLDLLNNREGILNMVGTFKDRQELKKLAR
mmetsp:Transcript_19299/g.29605  ORF Transcript_19299/g.29605 Transcript_19299/m.29605 type:complete len:103 (-) Transcript_19299:1268-1576(-)